MILGRVTGHVWATSKAKRLKSHKLAIIEPIRAFNHYADHVVAIDSMGSDIGQTVLVCLGAPARWQSEDPRIPAHAAVAGIVDDISSEDP